VSVSGRQLDGVLVTHIPTGISVFVQYDRQRAAWQARDLAMRALRSKVYAAKMAQPEREVANYVLPDGVDCPHDLMVYREDTK